MYTSNALQKVQLQGSALISFGFLFIGVVTACVAVSSFFSTEGVPSSHIVRVLGLAVFFFIVHGVTLPIFIRDYRSCRKSKENGEESC